MIITTPALPTVYDVLTTDSAKNGILNLPFDPHGWVDGCPELTVLINERQPKHIAEIGVWLGMTTKYFCSFSFVEDVLCVDHWDPRLIDPQSIDMSLQPPNRVEHLYNQFLVNCYRYGIWNRVYPLRMSSLEGAVYCADRGLKFDLIWIDADHSTKCAQEDILAWSALLSPTGILCGDDWNWVGEPYSVRTAVVDSAAMLGMDVHAAGNFWWYTPREGSQP